MIIDETAEIKSLNIIVIAQVTRANKSAPIKRAVRTFCSWIVVKTYKQKDLFSEK